MTRFLLLLLLSVTVSRPAHGQLISVKTVPMAQADQFQIFRPFCKRVYRVDRVADLPRVMERAFHLSQAGRPLAGEK